MSFTPGDPSWSHTRAQGTGTMAKSIRTLFKPHTAPYPHQWEALQASYAKRAFALVMDPGLGKTKVVLDTAALWYERGHVQAMLVLAPNDVHDQWVAEQVPLHWKPKHKLRAAVWHAYSTRSVRMCNELLKPVPNTFTLLAMNHEALATKRGRELARKFLRAHTTLLVLDESHEFKTPKATRTRIALSLAPLAFGRRICTGTLTDGTPFDFYAQYKFLSPAILQCDDYLVFKHRYAVWSKDTCLRMNPRTGRREPFEYPVLEEYQNLEDLQRRCAPYTFSKRKEDCEGLPEKTYGVLPTHLSKAQRELHDSLLDAGLALLERAERGLKVTDIAALQQDLLELGVEELAARVQDPRQRMTYKIKLTLMLRLAQCTAGIARTDDGTVHSIHARWQDLPRLATLVDHLRKLHPDRGGRGKVIVWAHYRPLVDTVLAPALAEALGAPPLVVHGGVTGKARTDILQRFKDPKDLRAWLLVAHPRTLGTGQNFAVARDAIYYTRSFSRIQRQQSEDRIQRLGSKGTVTVWDLVARDAPTDEQEMTTLAGKADMARELENFTAKELREKLVC